MSRVLSGKAVAAALLESLRPRVAQLTDSGAAPTLATLRAGDRPDSIAYQRAAVKRCTGLGIKTREVFLPADVSQDEFLRAVEAINDDRSIHGCLILMPLPKGIDAAAVRATLAPEKDVDGITPVSQAAVYAGRGAGFPPCTPAACMHLLHHYKIPIAGARAVVLGRSLTVGRPLAMLLMNENATVTICHTSTRNAAEIARKADILVAAVGHAGSVTAEFTNENQTIIDVGINLGPDGKLCGDVAQDASAACGAFSPVPGGIGSITTTVLAEHVVNACKALTSRT